LIGIDDAATSTPIYVANTDGLAFWDGGQPAALSSVDLTNVRATACWGGGIATMVNNATGASSTGAMGGFGGGSSSLYVGSDRSVGSFMNGSMLRVTSCSSANPSRCK
jgi:hypothetical protein